MHVPLFLHVWARSWTHYLQLYRKTYFCPFTRWKLQKCFTSNRDCSDYTFHHVVCISSLAWYIILEFLFWPKINLEAQLTKYRVQLELLVLCFYVSCFISLLEKARGRDKRKLVYLCSDTRWLISGKNRVGAPWSRRARRLRCIRVLTPVNQVNWKSNVQRGVLLSHNSITGEIWNGMASCVSYESVCISISVWGIVFAPCICISVFM